jgi:hypothetical protein
MFDKLGISGALSLLGGISTLMCVIPFLFLWRGERIRRASKFCRLIRERTKEMQRRVDEQRRRSAAASAAASTAALGGPAGGGGGGGGYASGSSAGVGRVMRVAATNHASAAATGGVRESRASTLKVGLLGVSDGKEG